MLTVDQRQSIHRQFRATPDRQSYRAWLVEMHHKTGRHRRSTRQFSAMTGLRWSIKTRWRGKKMLAGDDRESVGADFTDSGQDLN